jgi:uncharacterized membrane protein
MTKALNARTSRLAAALGVSAGLAMVLLCIRVIAAGNLDFWFLPWNLFLGYLPILFAWLFAKRTQKTRLMEWQNLVLAFLWLGFLPNSFYLITDIIHLRVTGDVSLLFDVVMMLSFVWSGLLAGFLSLYMMHKVALAKFSRRNANGLVAIVLLLCSFAIYLGRYLRWNTWDILLNPFSLVFDVSDRFINPSDHPQAFTTTLVFFVLLSSMYWSLYQIVLAIRDERR